MTERDNCQCWDCRTFKRLIASGKTQEEASRIVMAHMMPPDVVDVSPWNPRIRGITKEQRREWMWARAEVAKLPKEKR